MKSHYLTPLRTERLEGKWHRLIHPLVYYSERLDMTIITPPEFVTDLASVPRLPLVYSLAGGTMTYEAVTHDTNYRWGLISRALSDSVFFESGKARSRSRENQSWLYRTGRNTRNFLMTGVVRIFGWAAYDPVPGCLDYREKENCRKTGRVCQECEMFYTEWRDCFLEGHRPDALEAREQSALA